MQRKTWILILIFIWAGFYSCSENSSSGNSEELEVSEAIQQQAAFGFQANQLVSAGQEVNDFTSPQDLETGDVGKFFERSTEIRDEANRLTKEAQTLLAENRSLLKTTVENLIYQVNDTTGTLITRFSLFHEADSGYFRYEIVAREQDGGKRVQLDSTSIILDVNDLSFAQDDRLKSFYNLKQFAGTFLVQSISTDMTATAWDNSGDVTGFTGIITSIYNANQHLEKVVTENTINPDESGSIKQTFYFPGGETSQHTVVFNGDGTGSFSKTFRNGVSVSGTFDDVKDDGSGSYEATTSFPTGFYLARILKAAAVSYDYAASIVTSNFKEVVTFSDGKIDSVTMDIKVSVVDGARITEMDVTKSNGESGRFVITDTDNLRSMEGTWTNTAQQYIVLSAEYYIDGSAWLKYDVYASKSSFDAGDSPVASGEYNFSPNGSGAGRYTFSGDVYEVDLKNTGLGEIRRNGSKKAFKLYR